jgi:hypothetical protein
MIVRTAFLLLLIAVPAALAQSPQTCPWLTRGTAAKILGYDVTYSAHSDSNGNGSCRFAAVSDPSLTIEILVGKSDTHRCAEGAKPLPAIGNQAVLCSYRDANGHQAQTVSGRVRDAWFVITLTMPLASAETPAEPGYLPIPSSIGFLAEQVTGNLQ